MYSMAYNLKLNSVSEIIVGKTYYKNMTFNHFFPQFERMKILSHLGSIVTATIGDDTFVQTITETEAFYYINTHEGYSDTA